MAQGMQPGSCILLDRRMGLRYLDLPLSRFLFPLPDARYLPWCCVDRFCAAGFFFAFSVFRTRGFLSQDISAAFRCFLESVSFRLYFLRAGSGFSGFRVAASAYAAVLRDRITSAFIWVLEKASLRKGQTLRMGSSGVLVWFFPYRKHRFSHHIAIFGVFDRFLERVIG